MKKKVMHLIETDEPGGAETVLVEVAQSLEDEFEAVGLVVKEGWTSEQLRARNIPVFHVPLERSFDWGWVKKVAEIIRENNIQLLQSHEFTTNAYGTLAAKMAGIPIVCVIHGKNYYPYKFYRRLASRLVARYADSFIAVSEDLADFLNTSIGIPAANIKVIQNGVNVSRYSSATGSELGRCEFNLTDDDYVVIVVAALFENKGHKDLIKAAANLRDRCPNLKFLLVGEGVFRPELESLVTQLDLTEKVVFAGFRSDVAELLKISDLFVLPSYSEGLPVSVLEAMAASVPVIATEVGGLGELIEDHQNGYLVQPRDVSGLEAVLYECYEDSSATEAVAKKGYEAVVERFSISAMLDEYRAIYRKLLN